MIISIPKQVIQPCSRPGSATTTRQATIAAQPTGFPIRWPKRTFVRLHALIVVVCFLGLQPLLSAAFHVTDPSRQTIPIIQRQHQQRRQRQQPILQPLRESGGRLPTTTSRLSSWWFGGYEDADSNVDLTGHPDSCELVAVRIERPESNARQIFGEIHVPAPMEHVWSILTDYDRLTVHVPNLVESRIVQRISPSGEPGDGQFQCRLYQKGAQRIVGFEFGASVTMDMREIIQSTSAAAPTHQQQRQIQFKCYDSFFFSQFDGEWKLVPQIGDNGQEETTLSYGVYVKPRGPVPVAALEWRIREDVPTNLRAVKRAAVKYGASASSRGNLAGATTRKLLPAASSSGGLSDHLRAQVKWLKDETMATYLSDSP